MSGSMRLAVAFALAMSLGATLAWAQERPTRAEMEQQATKRMQEMRERLQLTDEQEEQVQPILAESAKRTREMLERYMSQGRSPSTMSQMREEMQKLQKENRAKLEEILSAEQLLEYDTIQQEWREERRRRMGGRGGRPSPDS